MDKILQIKWPAVFCLGIDLIMLLGESKAAKA